MLCCSRLAADSGRLAAAPSGSKGANSDWFRDLALAVADDHVRERLESITDDQLTEYHNWLLTSGDVPPSLNSLPGFTQRIREHWSLEGHYINRVRDLLDAILTDPVEQDILGGLRVGLVASEAYNAAAFRTPDGEAVLLNTGFVFHQRQFWKSFLGLASHNQAPPEPAPMCPHFSIFDFLYTLANEAVAIRQPSVVLRDLSAYRCMACGPTHWEAYADEYILLTELFVLLHELGHIALGHLDHEHASPLELQRDEYEADEWAVQRMCRVGQFDTASEAALGAGMFLVLAELCDSRGAHEHSTHPSARSRRERINTLCSVRVDDGSAASELDKLVADIGPVVSGVEDFRRSAVAPAVTAVGVQLYRQVQRVVRELGHGHPEVLAAQREFWAFLLLEVTSPPAPWMTRSQSTRT